MPERHVAVAGPAPPLRSAPRRSRASPARRVRSRIASRPRVAGRQDASASSTSRSFEPLPSVRHAAYDTQVARQPLLELVAAAVRVRQHPRAAARIAATVCGLGAVRVLVRASLTMSWMPSSRSSSEIGLPGTYGDSSRHRLAPPAAGCSSPLWRSATMRLQLPTVVGTQHPDSEARFFSAAERLAHSEHPRHGFDVDEEHVIPLAAAATAAIDPGHADAVARQRSSSRCSAPGDCVSRPTAAAWCDPRRSASAAVRPGTRKRVALSARS